MSSDEKRYWFPAKRYGWGWGFPNAWQGWAVLLVFVAAMSAAAVAGQRKGWQVPAMVVATAGLVFVGYRKGEPPRWRWGGDK